MSKACITSTLWKMDSGLPTSTYNKYIGPDHGIGIII